jgi:hypothetical protein
MSVPRVRISPSPPRPKDPAARRVFPFAAATFFALSFTAQCAFAGDRIDAPPYYRAALAAMQNVAQPPFLTYRTSVPAGDATLEIARGDDGRAELAVISGRSPARSWRVAYRRSDGIASVEMPDGTRLLSNLAMFDPTWGGAFAWLRGGIGTSIVTAPSEVLPPESTPAAGGTAPPLLAVVTAVNENAYRLNDGGTFACADGRAGRRIWAAAKSDANLHPLTEVVVDEGTHRFCTMRFHQRLSGAAATFDATYELHFAQAGRYYLITDGSASGDIRPRGGSPFRIDTSFRYDLFAFPATLPELLFTG